MMTETLTRTRFAHFSKAPITGPIRSVEQGIAPHFKPLGFWISVEGNGDGWKDWCEGEGFGTERLAFEHEVTLRDDAEILWLRSAADIDRFTDEWMPKSFAAASYYCIPWAPVAMAYQGIVIAPYIWSRRFDDKSGWYYSWDCASGCIWDASAIESVTIKAREE